MIRESFEFDGHNFIVRFTRNVETRLETCVIVAHVTCGDPCFQRFDKRTSFRRGGFNGSDASGVHFNPLGGSGAAFNFTSISLEMWNF